MPRLFVLIIFTTILLGSIFVLPAESRGKDQVLSYVTAYDLQELCFNGSSKETVPGQIENAICSGYIRGVLDFTYLASACKESVRYSEIISLLTELYKHTPNKELSTLSAAYTVYQAWSATKEGQLCIKLGRAGGNINAPEIEN